MNKKNKNNWKKSILSPSSTIKEAFSNLEETGMQIIFVCEENNKLLGTITDGDIRRGLLKGMGLADEILKITNKDPIVISSDIDPNTAEKIMNVNKIKSLPVVNKVGQLIDLYSINSLELKSYNNYDIVIMAGGMGKRLLPITKDIPKAMIKLDGEPMIQIIIKKFIKFGFVNFYISVNYLKEKIINYLKSGKKLGVQINYIKEKKPLGTIGSLSLLNRISKNFLVINCDVFTNLNFLELIKFHEQSKSALTIAANIIEQYNNFGEIKTDGTRVLSFIEKPVEKKYNNAGIYVFNKSVLKYVKKNQSLDINTFVNFLLNKNIKISVFPIYENWTDVGIKSELKKIKRELKDA
jgi:NDP-sugar pyrophosphorylase family protein